MQETICATLFCRVWQSSSCRSRYSRIAHGPDIVCSSPCPRPSRAPAQAPDIALRPRPLPHTGAPDMALPPCARFLSALCSPPLTTPPSHTAGLVDPRLRCAQKSRSAPCPPGRRTRYPARRLKIVDISGRATVIPPPPSKSICPLI